MTPLSFEQLYQSEWAELEADHLRAGAVAYLNVDSSASGPHFEASAVPALADFLR